ncbi:MAG: exodeoxyribonuclease VII large subunit [Pseudomonadota bacterium]
MQNTTHTYQVSELVGELRRLVELSYGSIWIEGEISSLSRPASGHIYFALKDKQAQIKCAMFKTQANKMKAPLNGGDLVRVRGKISVYTARGDLQCIVQEVTPAGQGDLHAQFEALKAKLNEAGLFANERKRVLPPHPSNIGVITSESAAALRDVLSTLERRCKHVPITVYPAQVQGESAASTLCSAINTANQIGKSDVLILTRGGGSMEDLWCFNDEQLAYAIEQSEIPIITAIGHEIDFTIADFVADLRAATPTAAAEMVSQRYLADQQQLPLNWSRLQQAMHHALRTRMQLVDEQQGRLVHPRNRLMLARERIDGLKNRLFGGVKQSLNESNSALQRVTLRLQTHSPSTQVAAYQQRLHNIAEKMQTKQQNALSHYRRGLESIGAQLNAISPLATLQRGYSISRDDKGNILRVADDSQLDAEINVQLSEGALHCRVLKIDEKQNVQ